MIKNILGKSNNKDNQKTILQLLDDKEKYLLGATALDCSVMLTFQQILPEKEGDLTRYVYAHVGTFYVH